MRKKIKNAVLLFSVCLAFGLVCLSAQGFYKGNLIPTIITAVCSSWIALFLWANKEGGAE